MRSSASRAVMAAMAALIAGCSASPEARPTPAEPTSEVAAGTTAPSPQPSPTATLGDFPAFPKGPLPESVAASLQAVLDGAVEQGTFLGVTAAVIVADSGSWSGATGVDLEGDPLTPDARLLIASVGKTVTAAQVLRLVEEGKLGLDDPAADHLPPEAASFDANGATIRDVLGMRSGIPDPRGYGAFVDAGSTPAELLERVRAALPRRVGDQLREHQLHPARDDHRARHGPAAVGGPSLGRPGPPRPRRAGVRGEGRAGGRWVEDRVGPRLAGAVGLRAVRRVRALRRLPSPDDRLPR